MPDATASSDNPTTPASPPSSETVAPAQTPAPAPAPAVQKKPLAALGLWALVLGILGIVFAVIPGTSGFGIFVAIVVLILGGIGLSRKGSRARAGLVLGAIGLILGIIFLNAYAGGASKSSETASDTSKSAGSPAKPAAPAKPAVPAGTAAELQALAAAKSYLQDGQGFSEAGLLGQLTSSYGSGFAQADAQWAIDHSGADWNAQALMSAKGYLADGQGFSLAGLTAQLSSPNGGQFTAAQAAYAVSNSGADWNAQAVIAAKGYLADGQGFSRQGLIEQLSSPYGSQFTVAQAEYAATQAGL